ncbi:MAG: alpha/beta fold hydrolase [Flammeovirgaceae bacterium]
MRTTKVNFTNSQGDQLAARLEIPADSHAHTYVLFAHCFTCNKNLTAVRNIARALTQEGFAVLRFDFTGLGESEGDFADTNFSSNIEDLVDAANFLEREYQAPKVLIGHSLGGAAVLVARHKIPSVQAVATIGAPYEPSHVRHLFQSGIEEINREGIAKVSIGGRPFTIKKQFIDDLESLGRAHSPIHNLNAALLVLHSPQDTTVEISNATSIYKAASHPRSFVSLDGADHLLMKAADSLYVGDVIATWVKRYVEIPKDEDLRTPKQVVVRIGDQGFTTDIKAGNHALTADEPADVGGNDFGPTPYDLLTSALGACTAMTLRMYADRKGWDLKEVRVHLEHGKVYYDDSGDTENQPKKIDHIERVIDIEGNLDDQQRQRLLEIANKCPVHRTLHSEVIVDSKLSDVR